MRLQLRRLVNMCYGSVHFTGAFRYGDSTVFTNPNTCVKSITDVSLDGFCLGY